MKFFFFQLLDTKSSDKKISLMHFLVHTVQEKFGDIINFEAELRFIEKAALGKDFFFFYCHVYCILMLIKIELMADK